MAGSIEHRTMICSNDMLTLEVSQDPLKVASVLLSAGLASQAQVSSAQLISKDSHLKASELVLHMTRKVEISPENFEVILSLLSTLPWLEDVVKRVRQKFADMKAERGVADHTESNGKEHCETSSHHAVPDESKNGETDNAPIDSLPPLTMRDQARIIGFLQRKLTNKEVIHVGVALGLNYIRLANLDSATLLLDMVCSWLRRDDNVQESGPPTWESLVKALERNGHNGVAENIRSSLC